MNMAELKKIAVIAGDGIGPEVVGEAIKVIKKVEELYEYRLRVPARPVRRDRHR